MRDETTSPDQGILTDGDSLQHGDVDAQPDVIADGYWGIWADAGIICVPIGIRNERIGSAADPWCKYDALRAAYGGSGESAVRTNVDLGSLSKGRDHAPTIHADKV